MPESATLIAALAQRLRACAVGLRGGGAGYLLARDLRWFVEDGSLKREGERRGARYLPGPLLGDWEK